MARLLQLLCVGLLILAYVSYVEAPQLFDRGPVVQPSPSGAVDAALAVAGDGGVVITPAQAVGVATALWRLHDEGLAQRNANAIAAIEVDPARGYDLSLIAYALAKSESLSSGPLANATVMVPLQSSYPAYFMALLALSPPQGDSGAIIAAVRSSLATPWRLAFVTEWGGSSRQFAPALDAHGYAMAPNKGSNVAVPPSDVPELVARYWQAWRMTGAPPSDPQLAALSPGPWTTVLGPTLHRSGKAPMGRTNVTTYRADPLDATYVLRIDAASNLTCFPIRVDETDTFGAPGTFQDPWRTLWGPLLPSGVFSTVRTSGVEQSCAMVRPGSVPGSVTLLGRSGGPIRLAGDEARADALIPFVGLFVLFALGAGLLLLAWWLDRRASRPFFPPYGYMTLKQTYPAGWKVGESSVAPALEASSLDELVRSVTVAAAQRSPDGRPPTLRYAWTDAGLAGGPADIGSQVVTVSVSWVPDADSGVPNSEPEVTDYGNYEATSGDVAFESPTLESVRGTAPAAVLGQTEAAGEVAPSRLQFLVVYPRPVPGLPDTEPPSIVIRPSRFESLRPLVAGFVAGSAIFGAAASSEVARAIWHKDWVTLDVVLILFVVAVALFAVAAWMYLTRAMVTADGVEVTYRNLLGATTRIARIDVAAVMICSVLLRKGMTFFQSRVFLLDGNGKAVFKFYGSFWSDADVEALARFLGVDLEGSRADWFTPAGLARAVPGSVNVFERHPRLFWVAAAIGWGVVVILIRLALFGLHGS